MYELYMSYSRKTFYTAPGQLKKHVFIHCNYFLFMNSTKNQWLRLFSRTNNARHSSSVYNVHVYTKNILKNLLKLQYSIVSNNFVEDTWSLCIITPKSPIHFFTIFDLFKSKSTMWRTVDRIYHNRNVNNFIIFLPRTFAYKITA